MHLDTRFEYASLAAAADGQRGDMQMRTSSRVIFGLALGMSMQGAAFANASDSVALRAAGDPAEAVAANPSPPALAPSDSAAERSDQDYSAPAPSSDVAAGRSWDVSITPYLWLPHLGATIDFPFADRFPGVGGGGGGGGGITLPFDLPIDFSKSRKDLLKHLKFAALVSVSARHKRLVLLTDAIYLSLGGSTKIRDIDFLDRSSDLKVFSGVGMAGYRVVDRGNVFLDALAGGRVVSIDAQASVAGFGQTFGLERKITEVAPIVGLRFGAAIDRRWSLGLLADYGSLGVVSTTSWEMLGTVSYRLSRHWRAHVGYRYVSLHQKDRFDVKVKLNGPLIAVSYDF